MGRGAKRGQGLGPVSGKGFYRRRSAKVPSAGRPSRFSGIRPGARPRRSREGYSSLENRMETDRRSVGAMVDGLVEDTKRIAMTPFSTLFDFLPRIVRDLSELAGERGGIDRLRRGGGGRPAHPGGNERPSDPPGTKLRGSRCRETSGTGALRGRPPAGRISISAAYRDSGKVELTVADDGPGVDIAKVRNSALKLGLLSPGRCGKA